MGYQEHQDASRAIVGNAAIITLSDTRTAATDLSGLRIAQLLEADGHVVAHRQLIPDDPAQLDGLISKILQDPAADVVITNGGTGISTRDSTIEVVERRLTRALPGFGELFRFLSFEQIGSGAMLSRATGGVAQGKLLFALPGSIKAVELAMTRLILPELRHLLHEIHKS